MTSDDFESPKRPGRFSRRYRKLHDHLGPRAAFLLMALPVVLLIALPLVAVNLIPGSSESCQVTGKDRAGNQGDMRVYTENCGTFTVKDNPFLLRFNSADVYGAIQEGETYDFNTVGIRLPIASMFPNVLEATPAS